MTSCSLSFSGFLQNLLRCSCICRGGLPTFLSNQIFHYTYNRHTPKRVRNLRGHLRVIAPGYNTVSLCRNIAQVASRWQLCVQFDWPEIWTTDLPLQRRRTLCRSTRIYLSCMPTALPWLVTGYFLTLRKKRRQYQMPINYVSHQHVNYHFKSLT